MNAETPESSKPDNVNSSPQIHFEEQPDTTKSVDPSEDVELPGTAHTPDHQNGSEHSGTCDQAPIGRILEVDVISLSLNAFISLTNVY